MDFFVYFIKIFQSPVFTLITGILLTLFFIRIWNITHGDYQSTMEDLKRRKKIFDNKQKELKQLIKMLTKEINKKEAMIEKFNAELSKIIDTKSKISRQMLIQAAKKDIEMWKKKRKTENSNEKKESLYPNLIDHFGFTDDTFNKKPGFKKNHKVFVKGKKKVLFEAFDNKILMVMKDKILNRKDYNIYSYNLYKGEKINNITRVERKKDAIGESPIDIIEQDSKFQQELNKLSPQKYYIFFIVRKNSFKVFKVACDIARKRGFVITWKPYNGLIYFREPEESHELMRVRI